MLSGWRLRAACRLCGPRRRVGGGTGGGGLLSTILGSLGGMFRAEGGPVRAGQPYIVGEKRPELFVPNQSGRIVPRVPSLGPPAIPGQRQAAAQPQPMSINVNVEGANGDDHI